MTRTPSATELRTELRRVSQLIDDKLDGLSESDANGIFANRQWSIRDELSHIVAWQSQFDREIRFALSNPGGTTPWKVAIGNSADRYDQWNQRQLENMCELNLANLLEMYHKTNGEWISSLETLNDEQLGQAVEIQDEGWRTIGRLFQTFLEHTSDHLHNIGEKLAQHRRQK